MPKTENDSRKAILTAAKAGTHDAPELPEYPVSHITGDLVQHFTQQVNAVGGKVVSLTSLEALQTVISEHYPAEKTVYSNLELPVNSLSLSDIKDEHDLNDSDLTILQGKLGVAENGAIWVDEGSLTHRVAPFICQHLVLLLEKDTLVPFLHEAYGQLTNEQLTFGTFISGPSKTADIEQSLVIGAHGPKSLLVCLVG